MKKYNLSHFDDAAENCLLHEEYACIALDYDNDGVWLDARKLFEALFLKHYTTFRAMHRESFGSHATEEDIIDIRVMAICFAREIARLKNNKKSSGFSGEEIESLHDAYEAAGI